MRWGMRKASEEKGEVKEERKLGAYLPSHGVHAGEVDPREEGDARRSVGVRGVAGDGE